MKTTNTSLKSIIAATTIAFSFGMVAQSAVLIDSTTNNGSFETNSGDNTTPSVWVAADISPLSSGNIENTRVKSDGTAPDGSFAAEFSNPGPANGDGVILDTGYVLENVNTFSLSFDWKDQFGFDGTPANQGVKVELFYSDDNTLTGTLTSLFSNEYLDPTAGVADGWMTETAGGSLSAGAGQNLWIAFSAVGNDLGYIGRLDNVQLSASIAAPEPSSLALMLIGALGLFKRRRSLR